MKPHTLLITFSLLASAWAGEPVTIEAESFAKQSLNEKRRWEIKAEHPGASGSSYIQALPDTRQSHDDKLIKGENFTDTPGEMAVLEYPIDVKEPGRYFVWARTWSSNSEDNGLHFGLDGQWPESGKRWQTVKKGAWHWDCKQRTEKEHTGVPMQLWLDIDKPGEHTLMMSMREDGAEVDQIILTKSQEFRPDGVRYGITATSKSAPKAEVPRQPDGKGDIIITGELKQWHTITVTVDGPNTSELADPNPFRDYRLDVTFTKGSKSYKIPGYYAADGNAAETGADSGNKWQAKFCPDETGTWSYSVEFKTGTDVAVNGGGTAVSPADGETGTFNIGPTDKTGKDFRAKGRLDYVGKHHLQFKGSGEYFFKTGVDSPENFLGFKDFDGNWKSDGYWNPAQTTPRWENEAASVKTYSAHVVHWKNGDPVWQGSKGKGIIGALNYMSGKGVNGVNPVTWGMWGDDPNVFMHLTHGEFYRFDCSKLDQWDIVFQHANNVGIMVHYKTQERENHLKFDNGTFLGPQRKLYLRELVARFGYHLGLEYNTGEEFDLNGGTVQDNKNIAAYIDSLDPFPRNILNHIYNWNEYYGENSFTGASVQNNWANGFNFTSKIIRGSEAKNKPWIVSFDEQGHHDWGVPPDSFQDSSDTQPNKHDIRKKTLWGTIMAGGSGVMLYFGYNLPHGDKSCEDFTLRSDSYDYMRIAREFLHNNSIPFHNMRNRDDLLSSQPTGTHCLAGDGVFVVHFLNGGTCNLNLPSGSHTVQWLNPATGEVSPGKTVSGGSSTNIGSSPNNTQDWVAFIGGKPVSTNPGAGHGVMNRTPTEAPPSPGGR